MDAIKTFKGQYAFLSNFYPIWIKLPDGEYPTVEHAYQAAKAKDKTSKEKIRLAKSPAEAKALGRTILLVDGWDGIKIGVMRLLLSLKFKGPVLRQMLLDTGDAILEEGNTWHDYFWGIDIETGKGQNMLGKLLMELRENLKQGKP